MRPELLAILLAAPALAEPAFVPVEIAPHAYTGGWEHFVGGGLAAFDCDGDGRPELFAAGGDSPAALFRNRSGQGALALDLDTPPELALTGVTGAYPLDIDGDGQMDLAVLTTGENRLLRGHGDCRFGAFEGLDFASMPRWTTAFSATWEQGQSLPTLAFGNYVDRTDPDGPFEACDTHALYRPDGMRYAAPFPLAPGYCALSMLFSDWNRDGMADLRISNDRHYYVSEGEEQLWRMTDPPRLWTEAEGWRRYRLWGMGIASRDLSGNGLPEVFLTTMADQRLQELAPDATGPSYVDVPFDRGTTAQRPYTGGDGRPSTGWHVAFGDVQNDGRDDVLIVKGNVDQMPGLAMDDPNNLLIQGPDGRFAEAGETAGLASLHRGRGGVLADLDGDGRLDVAVLNRRAPMEVWRNATPDTGAWLTVALVQPGGNRHGVGAWIEVDDGTRVHAREVTVGGGHAGGTALPEHFGLGSAHRARVRVIWPDGVMSEWQEVEANSAVVVTRE
jgi:hypothetical protein